VAQLLDEWGWLAIRVAGSLGPVDVVAVGGDFARWGRGRLPLTPPVVLLVQVKSTAGGAFERFGPLERAQLIELAATHSGVPLLAWWPPALPGESKREALRFLFEHEWPPAKVTA
jgi:Holliday junction resolvase